MSDSVFSHIEWVTLTERVRGSDSTFYRFTAYSPQLNKTVDLRRTSKPKKMVSRFVQDHYEKHGIYPTLYSAAESEFELGKPRWAWDAARNTHSKDYFAFLFYRLWQELWKGTAYESKIISKNVQTRVPRPELLHMHEIYTDASVSEDARVAGISAVDANGFLCTRTLTSKGRMPVSLCEAQAVAMAIDSLYGETPHAVRICSDSLATVDATNRRLAKGVPFKKLSRFSDTVEMIVKKIYDLELQGFFIDVSWVKGHAGIPLNELADKAAKTTLRNELAGIENRTKAQVNTWV